ncbi:hypothetical protein [Alteromonas flava]|uniref:hypothetical protein n=1 Tax=Alteromonas flava TaxID=2048003 RepID=UPI000C282A04|nr:hypothetical protein [Alteromonas flava]
MMELWNLITNYSTADARNVATVIFYVIIGFVTIKTYLHAKKAFFEPKTTEVYKLQISELREAFNLFGMEGKTGVMRMSGFIEMILSTHNLFISEYIKIMLLVTVSGHKIKYYDAAERYSDDLRIVLDTEHYRVKEIGAYKEKAKEHWNSIDEWMLEYSGEDPRPRWDMYLLTELVIPKSHDEFKTKLKKLAFSALLPEKLRKMFEDYYFLLDEVYVQILDELNSQKDELANNAKSFAEVRGNKVDDMRKRVIKDINTTKLETLSKEIRNYIRDYLRIESVMKIK